MGKWQLVSRLTLSFSILMLSSSIFYFSWVIFSVNASIPMVAEKIETASGAVKAAVIQVDALSDDISSGLLEFEKFNSQIPKALSESAEIRGQTHKVIVEFSEFNDRIPSILAESQNIREVLPGILDDVERIRVTVEESVAELSKARQELPSLIEDVNQLIDKADKAGVKASEGVISGVFTGLIKAPYNIIRHISIKSDTGERELTSDDRNILIETVSKLLAYDSIGKTLKFNNKISGVSGFVELTAQSRAEGRLCKSVRVVVDKNYDKVEEICQAADGQWFLR